MEKKKKNLALMLVVLILLLAYVPVIAEEQPVKRPEEKQEEVSTALWKYQVADWIITDLQAANLTEVVQAEVEKRLEESFGEIQELHKRPQSEEPSAEETLKKQKAYEEYLQSRCDIDVFPLLERLDALVCVEKEEEAAKACEEIRHYVYALYGFPPKETVMMDEISDTEERETIDAGNEEMTENQLLPAPVPQEALQEMENPQYIEDGIYLFRTVRDENRILEVEGGTLEDGGKVQVYEETFSDHQRWRVTSVGDYYYKIVNVHSEKALEAAQIPDATLQQLEDSGDAAQRWRFYKDKSGVYSIVSQLGIRIDTGENQSYARSRAVVPGWYLEQFAAVTGGRYYHTLAEAVNQCANGADILITGSHTSKETELSDAGDKSYSVLPSGGNYTVRYAESSDLPAAMLRQPDGGGKASTVINLKGNGSWTLTLDGNNCGSSAVISLGYGTLNVYPGVTIKNSKTNGIFNFYGVTNIYGGTITANRHAGVVSIDGTINIHGGTMSKNNTDGARAHILNMKAGTVEGNRNNGIATQGVCASNQLNFSGGMVSGNQNHGIYLDSSNKSIACTVSGGTVSDNGQSGIRNNSGTITMSGGTITGNSMSGIQNHGTLNLKNGDISGNTAPKGGGIYQGGTMYMNGPALVNTNNDVYLPVGKYVTVNGALTQTAKTVAKLTPADYFNGRKMVEVAHGSRKASAEYAYGNGTGKFSLSPKGVYLLRPGDFLEDKANTPDSNLVISSQYKIVYHKNIDVAAENIPPVQKKYWYERIKISELKPGIGSISFLGWNIDSKAEAGIYQSGETLSINQDLTLYAIWQTKLKVTYVGNGADSGTEKSEYITMQECRAKGDYAIRKNAVYTKYTREGHTFLGWNDASVSPPTKTVKYSEKSSTKASFEELLAVAKEDSKGMPVAVLSGAWDKVPEIKAADVLVFYEGTDVNKEMLLSNVRAVDQEDGNITKSIRITGITYADGKLADGEKQEGITEKWDVDMQRDYVLDTWFLQMDKADSPIIHAITYAVTDSAGNETTLDWTVQVKYNEFPVIETVDRYFTLEEAQSGAVTKEVLLESAFAEGKVKVTDVEDDMLHPGTIQGKTELPDFCPEEFTVFQESGYVVLTYSVKDSMGKDGIGKETTHQFTVHVIRDGEIVKPPSAKYVRFINEENYFKNASCPQDITDAEREARNKNGGLQVESKWYRDPEYRAAISKVWSKTTDPQAVWAFSQEEVRQAKVYVEAHGIGNSKEADALAGFAATFGSQGE